MATVSHSQRYILDDLQFKKITAKNTIISTNFLVWKFCAFPQNFHARKLGKISAFCAVIVQNIYYQIAPDNFDLYKYWWYYHTFLYHITLRYRSCCAETQIIKNEEKTMIIKENTLHLLVLHKSTKYAKKQDTTSDRQGSGYIHNIYNYIYLYIIHSYK